MPWTPLHASLGETTSALDFALVERCCIEGVPERSDLDWKQQLPLTATDNEARTRQRDELAKDIAAMANSGGGMIVYGVAETREKGTSAASCIAGVGVVDENTTRDIRRVAGNLIYPPVVGLDLIPLAPGTSPEDGVLAMLVPDSPDRPHLIRPPKGTDWFAAPYRHGPDTDWMVERQLASAYAERESGRRRRYEEFDARFEEFLRSLPQASDLRWVVAFAVPDQPHPRPRELTLQRAGDLLANAWSARITSAGGERHGPAALTARERARRGLQRFVLTGRRAFGASNQATMRARVEVHGDGALAVAFTRDGWLSRDEGRQYTQVPVHDIESTALDFLAVLISVREELKLTGDYSARLTVHPATEIFRISDHPTEGHYQPWNNERIYGYHPVDGLVLGTGTQRDLIASWVDIVTDAVAQAGAGCSLDANHLAEASWPTRTQ